MRKIIISTACILLSACATVPEPITINVPTPVMPEAPDILTVTPILPAPKFVNPGADDAAVCLDRDGVGRLKNIIAELAARETAWRRWYEEGRAHNNLFVEDVPARGFPPIKDDSK